MMSKKSHDTSWQTVAPWYNKLVGSEGHYFHEHTVLPGVLRLLDLHAHSSLLDLGCGQGILAKKIPTIQRYLGIDAAADLIASAKTSITKPYVRFLTQDVTKPLKIKETFSHAAIVLALQNMHSPQSAITHAAQQLETQGTLVIVLNHPCFRIPRQSGWGIDNQTKLQYRWINRYMSPLKIPITMHPGKQTNVTTWSFHHSLADFVQMLKNANLVMTDLEEWYSDKESAGKAAKMENRARSEFPLFLALKAKKI